ncbi:hypothetical protein HED60_00675 [Planctomycetales bacterium ZRK34]|nr:hypothetical protein HED60_00675 [Planctomycetales bacterium ZRK34]
MVHRTWMIGAAVALLGMTCTANSAFALLTGDYVGGWHNITFGSTGDASANVQITGPTAVTVSLDLDGNVFGGSDPTPLVLMGAIQMDGSVLFDDVMGHPTYGDVSGASISPTGDVSAIGVNVPAVFIDTFELGGGFTTEEHADLTYIVTFTDTSTANGTITLDRVPEPAALAVLSVGAALLPTRRRATR